ncbi:tetratricopeptide repeat protein [Gymnodinialimonas ceratoperidinii]|uniref:Sel1 repeat family protein n=1 Tax=Gymnodinialimonas ceratoperidinii TaxID=2856823 RepID=A0A8F6YEG2_9RHOB|nr:tetratricopeptide repeat protein [Gymnodinialimonas ceratoperidinii]QXT41197.1 sel1 repeat family protein [Gymnodinialimonas ceratoperidinii]
MPLPSAILPICLISVLALHAGGALAQENDAAQVAADEAIAALLALRAPSEEEQAEARAGAVEDAMGAFEALAAESAERVEAERAAAEAEAAAARAEAVSAATTAFEALAAESEARRIAEAEAAAEAERAAAVEAAATAFETLAAESEARRIAEAEAAAEAERAAAVEAAATAFEALAAESEARRIAEAEAAASAARAAAVEEAASAFEVLAAESAARAAAEAAAAAAAQAALTECVETAGPPSAENYETEEDQRAALDALRRALPACRAAAQALPEEGAPLFHLATAAQASGRHRRAVPLYESAAEAGVAAAMTRLGDYHNFGLRPVREDPEQAVAYYRQAADLGDPAGLATLAFMYRLGRGVEADAGEMLRLIEQAADAGYPFAQRNLAQTYLRGEGVPGRSDDALGIPNPPRAVPLLVTLASDGDVEAMQQLIALYSDGADGVPASDFLRGGWVEELAATGDPAGIAARGFLYEQGIGRAADPERAAADYIAALETGEVDITELRGTINGQTPPWERETAMAFQTILAERGLYTMRIDGDIGPGTRRAARALSE